MATVHGERNFDWEDLWRVQIITSGKRWGGLPFLPSCLNIHLPARGSDLPVTCPSSSAEFAAFINTTTLIQSLYNFSRYQIPT